MSTEDKQLTAVEYFFLEMCDLGFIEFPDDELIKDRLEKAKKIQNKQIFDAFNKGVQVTCEINGVKNR